MQENLQLPEELQGRVWVMDARNGHRQNPIHRHSELEINLVISGRGVYLIEDRTYELQRNSQLWLFPAQEHVLLETSRDFAMWILVFRPVLVDHACQTETTQILREQKPRGDHLKQLPEVQARRLIALFSSVLGAESDTDRYNAGLAFALLEAWSAQRAADVVPVGADIHPAVERAVRCLRYETEPLNLDAVSRLAGLSSSRLSRLFKQQTGVALVEFRNRQRLERFLTLYGRGQRTTMLPAALDAGFGSYPQFHRVFRQVLGCSPREYYRQFR